MRMQLLDLTEMDLITIIRALLSYRKGFDSQKEESIVSNILNLTYMINDMLPEDKRFSINYIKTTR